MTKTLFRSGDKAEMLARIARLTPDAPPQWGKMNAAQMMAHCSVGLRVALGELNPKRIWFGYLIGGIAKRQVMGPKPTPRNLPTGPDFLITDARDFGREREQLIDLIERFSAGGDKALTQRPHPFFGRMTSAEWQRLMWKHLDHHLQQFGAD